MTVLLGSNKKLPGIIEGVSRDYRGILQMNSNFHFWYLATLKSGLLEVGRVMRTHQAIGGFPGNGFFLLQGQALDGAKRKLCTTMQHACSILFLLVRNINPNDMNTQVECQRAAQKRLEESRAKSLQFTLKSGNHTLELERVELVEQIDHYMRELEVQKGGRMLQHISKNSAMVLRDAVIHYPFQMDPFQMEVPWSEGARDRRKLVTSLSEQQNKLEFAKKSNPDKKNVSIRLILSTEKITYIYNAVKQDVHKLQQEGKLDENMAPTEEYFRPIGINHLKGLQTTHWYFIPNKELYKQLVSMKTDFICGSKMVDFVFFHDFNPDDYLCALNDHIKFIDVIEYVKYVDLTPAQQRFVDKWVKNTPNFQNKIYGHLIKWMKNEVNDCELNAELAPPPAETDILAFLPGKKRTKTFTIFELGMKM
jgi:hypothetical protein